jgi:Spx/MgsR family transcriptional regulator
MARPAFYWNPSCTTCRKAKAYLDKLRIDVQERDINKAPPSREFLEQHVDEQRFLDFIGKRSPVFKTRPLPTSKEEAIDLMVDQATLIKRPILIKGSTVIFGFDKIAYDKIAYDEAKAR